MRNSISVSSMAPTEYSGPGAVCDLQARHTGAGIAFADEISLTAYVDDQIVLLQQSQSPAQGHTAYIHLQGQPGSEGSWLPGGYTPSCIMEYRRLYTFTCFNFFAFSDNTSGVHRFALPVWLCHNSGCIRNPAVSLILLYHKNIQVLIQHHNSQRLFCQ